MKVAVIGGGNMGAALAASLLNSKQVAASELLIVEVDKAKREELSESLRCEVAESIDS